MHKVLPTAAQLALREAARVDPELRIAAINRVTDALAKQGLVRPRSADNGWLPKGR